MFKTLILAATAATAISVGALAKTAVPSQEACRAVITAALDKVMKQAPPKGWLKNVPSVDLVIYDYQVYRRGDKSAFNWSLATAPIWLILDTPCQLPARTCSTARWQATRKTYKTPQRRRPAGGDKGQPAQEHGHVARLRAAC